MNYAACNYFGALLARPGIEGRSKRKISCSQPQNNLRQ